MKWKGTTILLVAIVIIMVFKFASYENEDSIRYLYNRKLGELGDELGDLERLDYHKERDKILIALTEIKKDSKMIVDLHWHEDSRDPNHSATTELSYYIYQYLRKPENQNLDEESWKSIKVTLSEVVKPYEIAYMNGNLEDEELLERIVKRIEKDKNKFKTNTILQQCTETGD